MAVPERVQLLDPSPEALELVLGLGHQHLTVGSKATVVIDEFSDAVPQLHRIDGERDLGHIPRELPDAPGVHPRRVPAGVVLLQQEHLQPPHRAMQSGRAAVDAAADDDDVGPGGAHRTTALVAASVFGSAASSARVTGFTGGRRR